MGFKEVRARLIEALQSDEYGYDERPDGRWKNLLATDEVTAEFVVRLLLRCQGWEYSTSKHHFRDVECHIFTPAMGGERWYVKAYFEPGRAMFISVHR
jgi:hypothetical protein